MTVLGGDDLLPCGMSVAALVDQVAGDGAASAHQQSCPFCGQALGDLNQWWAPIRRLAAEPIRAPAGLIARVMDRIGLLPGSTQVVLRRSERGETSLSIWAVAAVAARAAGGVPGVAMVLGSTACPLPGAAGDRATGPATGVGVSIEITATSGVPIPPVVAAVRRAVSRHLWALAGVEAVEVDVSVEGLVDEDAPSPGHRAG